METGQIALLRWLTFAVSLLLTYRQQNRQSNGYSLMLAQDKRLVHGTRTVELVTGFESCVRFFF
jgi:hypothetical protein